MLKNSSNQERFQLVKKWLPDLLSTIKKDLRQDHLKHDHAFVKKYLNKPYQKAEIEDLVQAYSQAIDDGSDMVAEFITQRWLLKHTEIYDFFAGQLSAINPDFSELDELNQDQASSLADNASTRFGARDTYIFSVLNAVVFPKKVFEDLSHKADKESHEKKESQEKHEAFSSLEKVQKEYELKISRLTDKYEKKLSGMEHKYLQDTALLKKQVAQLQRKLGTPA